MSLLRGDLRHFMPYVCLSTSVAAVTVYYAFSTREHFYPAMVYLATSKVSIVILGNLVVSYMVMLFSLLIKVFFGRLNDSEAANIAENVPRAMIETCLAMTTFAEDFGPLSIALFGGLLFFKIMHWIVQSRVHFLDTQPVVTRAQYFRIATFLAFLGAADYHLLHFSLARALARPRSVLLLFAFEFAILGVQVLATTLKFLFSAANAAMQGRWEGKSVWVMHLELVTEGLVLLLYASFFLLVMAHHVWPIHLMHDLYHAFATFRKRLVQYMRFRRLMASMDSAFEEATGDDLLRCDHVCIICREEMQPGAGAKKLPCRHCFHVQCLRGWMEHNHSCPTCRTDVFQTPAPRAAAAAQQAQQAPAVPAARPAAAEPPHARPASAPRAVAQSASAPAPRATLRPDGAPSAPIRVIGTPPRPVAPARATATPEVPPGSRQPYQPGAWRAGPVAAPPVVDRRASSDGARPKASLDGASGSGAGPAGPSSAAPRLAVGPPFAPWGTPPRPDAATEAANFATASQQAFLAQAHAQAHAQAQAQAQVPSGVLLQPMPLIPGIPMASMPVPLMVPINYAMPEADRSEKPSPSRGAPMQMPGAMHLMNPFLPFPYPAMTGHPAAGLSFPFAHTLAPQPMAVTTMTTMGAVSAINPMTAPRHPMHPDPGSRASMDTHPTAPPPSTAPPSTPAGPSGQPWPSPAALSAFSTPGHGTWATTPPMDTTTSPVFTMPFVAPHASPFSHLPGMLPFPAGAYPAVYPGGPYPGTYPGAFHPGAYPVSPVVAGGGPDLMQQLFDPAGHVAAQQAAVIRARAAAGILGGQPGAWGAGMAGAEAGGVHAQHAHVASLLHYASVLQSVNEANGMLERHLERLKKQLRQAEEGGDCAAAQRLGARVEEVSQQLDTNIRLAEAIHGAQRSQILQGVPGAAGAEASAVVAQPVDSTAAVAGAEAMPAIVAGAGQSSGGNGAGATSVSGEGKGSSGDRAASGGAEGGAGEGAGASGSGEDGEGVRDELRALKEAARESSRSGLGWEMALG